MDLIFFAATWADRICDPYRLVVSEVASRLALNVVELDCDDNLDAARGYGVTTIPSVVLRSDTGGVIAGARDAAGLEAKLRERLAHQ